MGKHGPLGAAKPLAQPLKKQAVEEEEDVFEESDAEGDKGENESSEHASTNPSSTHKKKKKSKAPVEISATKPVSRFRNIVAVPKKSRDPRFESFTGRYNEDLFRKSYAFVDDVRHAEVRRLREELTKEKDEEKREVVRTALQMLKRKDEEAKIVSEAKHAEREKVAQGKKPFFMKKSEKRNLVMIKKLEQLEKRGGLDKYMEKQLKRRAQKDHKRMPRARVVRSNDGPALGKRQRRDD